MHRSSATLRISFGLASLTVCVLLAAVSIGLVPDRAGAIAEGRTALCEAIAVNCTLAAQRSDTKTIDMCLRTAVNRNSDVLSAALRKGDGELLVEVGDHQGHWPDKPMTRSTLTHMHVPIMVGDSLWGTIELRFLSESRVGMFAILDNPAVGLTVFVAAGSFLANIFYLRKLLQHLDPGKVIPGRVRTTLDTLAEGLVVMDQDQRIVLANSAFAETVGKSAEELQGQKASDFPWMFAESRDDDEEYPWELSINDGAIQTGTVLRLDGDTEHQRVFKVNSAPIMGENGASRGALASFDDVTVLEQRNTDLKGMLEKLRNLRQELLDTARQAGMAEVATAVLHNVGNVLNSLNVSADVVAKTVSRSGVSHLVKAADLIGKHADDLGEFFTQDEKGKRLPDFLSQLADHLVREQEATLGEIDSLVKNIEHIKEIVHTQQAYTGVAGIEEPCVLADLMEDALQFAGIEGSRLEVVRDYDALPPVPVEKAKLMQILVNLIKNAKQAMMAHDGPEKVVTLRIKSHGDDRLRLQVADTGVGIAKENLTKIFSHGFTTKADGHGFGLHSASNAATEMGGLLRVASDGLGEGATFTIEIPFVRETVAV